MMTLREEFRTKISPKLKSELGVANVMAVPTLEKVTIMVGISPAKHKDGKLLETAEDVLRRISGQKPVKTLARKSISNFKIREGQAIGLMVTMRGRRMWDFVERLIGFTFPRMRDFRGVPESVVDSSGNLTYGFAEHLAFPEIRPDEVERIHGLQVTITTTAGTREEGLALFRSIGFPFQKLREKKAS